VIAGFACAGKLWTNKTYVGANIFQVLMLLAAFSFMMYLFYRMDGYAMRRFSRVCWLVIISGHLTGFTATNWVKDAVARPRPLNAANAPWNEQVRTVPDEVLRGKNSFPSGHTSGTFALLTPFFWYVQNRKARAGLMGWGVLQGFSRVYTAAHFPFCCLMGGILGFSAGTLTYFVIGPLLLLPPPKTEEGVQT
jgi:membrane-associated phospholipid phosphatase